MDSLLYDATHNDTESALLVSAKLRYLPPFGTTRKADELPTSGLDCLTQVIRHIYSYAMSFEEVIRSDKEDGEEENPLLKYAWQSMERDGADGEASEAQTTEQAARKQALLKYLIDSGKLPHGRTPDFEGLSMCQFMNRTLWGRNEFALYLPVFQRTDDRPEWHRKPGGSRQEAGNDSLLVFDCTGPRDVDIDGADPVSLQACMDRSFGPRGEHGNQELWLCGLPSVVRAWYFPNEESPLPFESLRTFKLPIADTKRRTEGDDIPIDVLKITYVIVAVVRHGSRSEPGDYVRTYDLHGTPVQLLHKPPAFVNGSWSVEDKTGHSYSLLYMAYPAGVNLSVRFERQGRDIPQPSQDLLDLAALVDQDEDGSFGNPDVRSSPRHEPAPGAATQHSRAPAAGDSFRSDMRYPARTVSAGSVPQPRAGSHGGAATQSFVSCLSDSTGPEGTRQASASASGPPTDTPGSFRARGKRAGKKVQKKRMAGDE